MMEYVEGQNLKSWLASHGGRISWQQALELLVPVMKALSKVHAQHILHRDISPDNICITDSGEKAACWISARRACHPGRREKRIGHPEARNMRRRNSIPAMATRVPGQMFMLWERRCTAASPAFCRRTRWSGCTAIR